MIFWLGSFLICVIFILIIMVYGIYFNSIKLIILILSIVITFLLIEFLIESNLILLVTYVKYKRALHDKRSTNGRDDRNYTFQQNQNISASTTSAEFYRHMKNLLNQNIFEFNYQMKKRYEFLNHKFSGLWNELYRQSIYLIALLLLIYGTRNSLGFYSTNHNKKFVLSGELNSMPLDEIYSDNDVWTFIENDFLKKIHEYKNGWIHGHVLKLLGVARIRQLRINNDSLDNDKLNSYNEDRINYFPKWKSDINFRYGKYYWRILDPWKYRTGAESKSLPVHGTIQFYPSGGYITQLGRNLNNSLKITNFLRKTNWIDRQTRVIFIEYTFYGADSNLFNVNTIIMEKTIYDNYLVTPYIQTTNLLLILEDVSIVTIVLFIILIVLTLIFFMNLVRELFKNRQNFVYNLWNIIDLAIVITISIMIIVFFVRNFYVHNLLQEMEKTRNNEFISFYYAALFDLVLAYVGGLLICISIIRLWKILNYFDLFYALTKTLQQCMKSIAALTLFMGVCLMGYGLAVFVVNGSESILFYNFTKVLTTLIALSFGFNEDMPWSDFLYGGTTMGLFLYFILLVEFNIFIINMYVTVIMYHLSLVKEEEKPKFYTLLEYSKEKWKKLAKLCCKIDENPVTAETPDLINDTEPIENEIPNITGSLHNAMINSQIAYATELCDNIDWGSFQHLDDDNKIPDNCGLVYRERKTDVPEQNKKDNCGLLYRTKLIKSKF